MSAMPRSLARSPMTSRVRSTCEQQSCLTLHRTRHLFIRQQTSVINVVRALFAEFGIVALVGRNGVEQLLEVAADSSDKRLPDIARACVAALGAQLRILKAQILEFDRMIMAWHRSSEACRRPDDIPGIGPALATALVASVAGLGWCRSRTRAEARTGSAASASEAIAGSRRCWHGAPSEQNAESSKRSRHCNKHTEFYRAHPSQKPDGEYWPGT